MTDPVLPSAIAPIYYNQLAQRTERSSDIERCVLISNTVGGISAWNSGQILSSFCGPVKSISMNNAEYGDGRPRLRRTHIKSAKQIAKALLIK